jgi:hypothetical protein
MHLWIWALALFACVACSSTTTMTDAGADAARSDAAPLDASSLDAGPPDAAEGPSDGGPPDAGDPCVPRCLAVATGCGAPGDIARAQCDRVCGAAPESAQLECIERLSCEASACTYPANLPCAIGETDSVPVAECMTVCVATATRCGAPAEIANARCAADCPLVLDGHQLACLRDAPCAELVCIENAGALPCGIRPST